MKKILAIILALTMVLGLTACGGGDAPAPSNTTSVAAPTSTPAPTPSTEPTPAPAPEAPKYPSYIPKYSMDNLYNGDKDIARNESVVFYNKAEPTTVQYTELARELEGIYKGTTIEWPELDDQWKSWNYTEIVNADGVSSRTMKTGEYQGKGDKVISEHIGWLKGIVGDDFTELYPEDEDLEQWAIGVPYSVIETTKSLTNKELAGAAYEMFYLQTWHLIPAENQGVILKTPDGEYTAEKILEMNQDS